MLWGQSSKIIRATNMGKQGPCYHCGITSTPLWRNGPPEKPVLCNACGSRWRTKGTLVNYTPMHARCIEATDSLHYKCCWSKKGFQKPKQQRLHKRKEPCDDVKDAGFEVSESDLQCAIDLEVDVSNRSSSGSGISYSEGCVQYSDTIAMDCTGSMHIPVWDSHVPSKKRTCMYRKRPSSVEELTKGLRYILHEQGSSYLSGSPDDLIFADKTPMVAVEIGLGSVFIRKPQSVIQEEESKASLLLIENKGYNTFDAFAQADSGAVAPSVQLQAEDKNSSERRKEKVKQSFEKVEPLEEYSDKSCMPNKVLSENFAYNKADVLRSCHSPLIFLELKDIINFDAFMELLTVQERKHLTKYISSVDIARGSESLKCMFNSVQFQEALINFQQLLSEGMFDIYVSGLSPQAQKILQKLIVTDLTNSKWIERYSQPQNQNKRKRLLDSTKVLHNKEITKTKGSTLPPSTFSKAGTYVAVKNSSSWQPCEIMPGSEYRMKSPVTGQNFAIATVPNLCKAGKHQESTNTGYTSRDVMELEAGPKSEPCFHPSSLFVSPLERSSCTVLDSTEALADEGFELERDLLLDVPSNISLQQAELLHTPVCKCKASKDSMVDANNLENLNSWGPMAYNPWNSEDSLDWSGLF